MWQCSHGNRPVCDTAAMVTVIYCKNGDRDVRVTMDMVIVLYVT